MLKFYPLDAEQYLMSQTEVAQVLGICKQNVSFLERRALKKLAAGMLADPYIREYIRTNCVGPKDLEKPCP